MEQGLDVNRLRQFVCFTAALGPMISLMQAAEAAWKSFGDLGVGHALALFRLGFRERLGLESVRRWRLEGLNRARRLEGSIDSEQEIRSDRK